MTPWSLGLPTVVQGGASSISLSLSKGLCSLDYRCHAKRCFPPRTLKPIHLHVNLSRQTLGDCTSPLRKAIIQVPRLRLNRMRSFLPSPRLSWPSQPMIWRGSWPGLMPWQMIGLLKFAVFRRYIQLPMFFSCAPVLICTELQL